MFGEQVKEYTKRRNAHKENVRKIYIIQGLCDKSMQAKLGAVRDFDIVEREKDSSTLLSELNNIYYKYDGNGNPYLALYDINTKLYVYHKE